MARPKTYHIMLSDNEVAALCKVIKDKKTCKTVLKRCQILLELDEIRGSGLTHSEIFLNLSSGKIYAGHPDHIFL